MAEQTLRAGVAEVDVTPPMGVEMCGYGPYLKRVCTDVLDPLRARALWLESGGSAVVLITADLCTVDASTRDEVAREISRRCRVGEESVLVAASHTHSGPATQLMIAWGERDPGYMASLPGLLVEAALEARRAAQPARLGVCRARIFNVGVNREQGDFGPLDTAAQLLRVDRADGTPLAAVFNFGAHAVTRYPFTSRISADWPGLVAAAIKHEMRGAVALFLQAPCGNINGHRVIFDRTDRETRQKVCDMQAGWTAQHFCEQALPALRAVETKADAALGAALRRVALPCVRPDRAALEETVEKNLKLAESMKLEDLPPLHERPEQDAPEVCAWQRARFEVDSCRKQLALLDAGADSVEAPLQVLRVGEAAIAGWPGEVFVELGIELRQRSPVRCTFVASFANHCAGYIPTEAAYESQGQPHQFGIYPTTITPRVYGRLPFRKDVGRIFTDTTLAMLSER